MASSSIWKILLLLGLLCTLVAFVLGWIGFGVPDWQVFQRYNGSIVEFYGLWAYCQQQAPTFNTVCKRWPTAETQLFNGSRPSFIRASEGLITSGMILLSLSFVVAIAAVVLPIIAYLAAILAFLAFLLLVIGLPIFGRQSNALSQAQGNVYYNKRYGFWFIVPTIVLEFLATLLFLAAAALYSRFGFGNLATRSNKPIRGGQRVLGPANVVANPPLMNMPFGLGQPQPPIPYGPRPFGLSGAGDTPIIHPEMVYSRSPTLLSEYLNQTQPRSSYPSFVPPIAMSALPQPSVIRATTPSFVSNVAPSYLRIGEPVGPQFTPIINLTGQTLVGPLVRTA